MRRILMLLIVVTLALMVTACSTLEDTTEGLIKYTEDQVREQEEVMIEYMSTLKVETYKVYEHFVDSHKGIQGSGHYFNASF